jgi:hypothetical protein
MVVFIVGGQFYEIAHADLIWLGFMLAVILDTLSREQRSETVGEDFVLAAADGDAAPARTQRLDTPTE